MLQKTCSIECKHYDVKSSKYNLQIYNNIFLKNQQMRHTIQTKSYNATIQIPYQKLARPHTHCIPLQDLQKTKNPQNGKTILIQGCHPQNNTKQQTITIKMLEELEQAFDYDMRSKDKIIQGLREDNRRLSAELGAARVEVDKLRNGLVEAEKKYLQAVRTIKSQDDKISQLSSTTTSNQTTIHSLQQQTKSLCSQISQLSLTKSQYQQTIQSLRQKLSLSQYQNKAQQEQIGKLSDSLQKVTYNCQKYLKDIEALTQNNNNLQARIGKLESDNTAKDTAIQTQNKKISMLSQQIQRLNGLLDRTNRNSDELKLRVAYLEADINKKQGDIKQLFQTRTRLEAELVNKNRDIQELSRKVQMLNADLQRLNAILAQRQSKIKQQQSQLQKTQQSLSQCQKQLQKQIQATKILANTILSLQEQCKTVSSHLSALQQTHRCLSQAHEGSQLEVQELSKSNSMFMKKIMQLQQCIKILEQQLRDKDVPKNFDVKIQKVVERKEYIQELQTKLQNLYSVINKNGDKVKEMERLLAGKEREIMEKTRIVRELETKLAELRAYVENKEKSFAWIVQRQIVKDMELNKQVQPTYKVYPTSPGVQKSLSESYTQQQVLKNQQQTSFSRLPNPIPETKNLILGGTYTTGVDGSILGELEKGGQLRDHIYRQAQPFRREPW